MALIPALFMTMVTVSFVFVSPTFLGAFLPRTLGYCLAAVVTAGCLAWFFHKEPKAKTLG